MQLMSHTASNLAHVKNFEFITSSAVFLKRVIVQYFFLNEIS